MGFVFLLVAVAYKYVRKQRGGATNRTGVSRAARRRSKQSDDNFEMSWSGAPGATTGEQEVFNIESPSIANVTTTTTTMMMSTPTTSKTASRHIHKKNKFRRGEN